MVSAQVQQEHKMARGWQFWISKVEKIYYTCSENKCAGQLRGDWEADLHLCFRICKMMVSHDTAYIGFPLDLENPADLYDRLVL